VQFAVRCFTSNPGSLEVIMEELFISGRTAIRSFFFKYGGKFSCVEEALLIPALFKYFGCVKPGKINLQ
jgi:hypothetical protein